MLTSLDHREPSTAISSLFQMLVLKLSLMARQALTIFVHRRLMAVIWERRTKPFVCKSSGNNQFTWGFDNGAPLIG